VLDPAGLVMLAGLVLVAGALFFPGFPYGAGDKDPGAYVNHAIQIARHGSIRWTDPALERVKDVSLVSPGAQRPAVPGALWPALWLSAPGSAVISPQFYHLWPALLASAFSVGGYSGLANVTPLVGVLAVLALALAVRRVFGLLAGSLAGLLLAANMLQVWQARYPTTEMLTQLLVIGSLLGLLIALQSGWGLAAGIAGLLLGVSFLTRPDGLLLVLLAVATGFALVALRRFDRRAGWFAAGLALTLAQAYGIAERYTLANGVPPLRTVALVVLAGLAEQARAKLEAAGLGRVLVKVGDGTLGVPEHAPYRAIVVAAASPRIPAPLVEQLAPGGRLVHPVGPGGHELVTAFHKQGDRLIADRQLTPARFVPLIGTHGMSRTEPR
jgi:hypothetical protein